MEIIDKWSDEEEFNAKHPFFYIIQQRTVPFLVGRFVTI